MSESHIASRSTLRPDRPSMINALIQALPRAGAVSASAFDRVVAAVDASHYLLTPEAVVTPESVAEVSALFAFAKAKSEPLTLRSGGTSLSGQASAANILVDTRKSFRGISIEDDGAVVRVGPGATLRQVNARLARFGRKLGPDPASEIACTIGGVLANNSSGMACGTVHNSYRTLLSATIVLPSGTVIDTSLPDADQLLQKSEPAIWSTLNALRGEIVASSTLTAEIIRQHRIKNTMGYGLNSLLDYETPVEMLAHLMIGSEGTLGFIAEARLATVPLHPCASTTLLVFESIRAATDSLVDLITTSPTSIELMDAASLRAAGRDPDSKTVLPNIEFDGHCALLVEYQASTVQDVEDLTANAEKVMSGFSLAAPVQFSQDAAVRGALWRLRKGLYATVAGARPSGTTALLEDIAVPVEKLSETCDALRVILERHGYKDAVIFGHAKDGNIHFLITERFDDPTGVERYRRFTEDLVDVVLGMGGTLKAEHGTGRIMAPFVRRQYGDHLYRIMWDIKRVIDPEGIMNPNAVLTDIPDLHLRDLKSTPSVEEEVDRCVECGYCEPVCPSKNVTTTPRQRIVLQRAIEDAHQRGDRSLVSELEREREHEVIQTCAVDGMCEVACPVLINTGDLVKRLRGEAVGIVQAATWSRMTGSWDPFTRAASAALTIASRVPAPLITLPNKAMRALMGKETVPLWSTDLPGGGPRRISEATAGTADVVYFAACVGTLFGPAEGGAGVSQALGSLAAKAGVRLRSPEKVAGLCCGTPWKSKGIQAGFDKMILRTTEALWAASDGGRIPIVCDNSSCSEGLRVALDEVSKNHPDYSRMTLLDSVDYAAEYLLPRLTIDQSLQRIALHPTCSGTRAGSNANLERIASTLAKEVIVPASWGCCAFAGDRGMLHAELTASATESEARELEEVPCDEYVSSNRTCEIGMSRATGRTYRHVLEVLDRLASPRRDAEA